MQNLKNWKELHFVLFIKILRKKAKIMTFFLIMIFKNQKSSKSMTTDASKIERPIINFLN